MKSGRPIYVLGSGGLAREMAQLLQHLGRDDAFAGYIARDRNEVGQSLTLGRVVGDDDWLLGSAAHAELVLGVGHPKLRANLAARYAADPDRFSFPNLIHPSAVVDPQVVAMGLGNVITAGCLFTVDIRLGSFNLFNWHVTVGHDAVVGSSCVVNPGSNISGYVTLGDRVLVGTGAQILEHRQVGDDASVGGGAVVTYDVDAGVTVIGVPAHPRPSSAS